MRSICLLALCCIVGLLAGAGCMNDTTDSTPSAAERIFVDGQFADWAKVTPLHTDPRGDGVEAGIDLGRLWVGHDRRLVFLRIDVGQEINLQNDNALTLYLDTDNDRTTGASVQGLGADLTWTFGDRAGQLIRGGDTTSIGHADVGLVTAPTVSSTMFEIAFDRQEEPALFAADTVRVAWVDAQAGGDRMPDSSGGIAYPLAPVTSLARLDTSALAPAGGGAMRVVSYNVQSDGLFDDARRPAFRRLLQAIQPDVIGFQEVYDHGAAETQGAVEELIGASEGTTWHSAKAGLDLVAVSRYPIRATYEIPGHDNHRSAGFLIDAQATLGTDVLFIVMHPPCCSGGTPPADARRQVVVDQVLAFLRDAQSEGGELDIAVGTPVIVAGDMNFVGDDQLPFSLQHGAIADTGRFGAPFGPDWDGSSLTDLAPRLTGWPMNFTWYSPESSFSPGRLDYIYYTDSVLRPIRHYTLFTPTLADTLVSTYRLQPDDAVRASDHLPLVMDVIPARE